MDRAYKKAYGQLNPEQKKAVDTTEGPVQVIAGPGTGKTQLLSTRIAHILATTDTPPENILALTFTDSGVQAMRDRLSGMIGDAAYDIQISTYHSFGSDLIRRYPEYVGQAGMQPIDELGRDSMLRSILEGLPYGNPLRATDVYLRDLQTFISESKRALLKPETIAADAKDNLVFVETASKLSREIIGKLVRVDKKSVLLFESLLTALKKLDTSPKALGHYAVTELEVALQQYEELQKTTPITVWKNAWLAKDGEGVSIFAGRQSNQKLIFAADVFAQYQTSLAVQNQYDYDDMILKAIEAMESNLDFKLTLSERYLYILLDEFQDTNLSQMRLIELLSDNPVHEQRPNVMAVGDDDQAIYAFQGADHSNMLKFYELYRDVKLVTLIDNYRSQGPILAASQHIVTQIEQRLNHQLKQIKKDLLAVSEVRPKAVVVDRHEFVTDATQYDWVAAKIAQLVASGIKPQEIAVLAPRHRYLQPLLPYLRERGLAIHYEKRENVLDDQLVRELEAMARLVVALHAQDFETADSLWPAVLSFPFWELENTLIWELSWQAYDKRTSWTPMLLRHEQLERIAGFFTRLADLLFTTTAEQLLDVLIGVADESLYFELQVPPISTFYDYYFGNLQTKTHAALYMGLLSNLTVIRQRLRDFKRYEQEPLSLSDFITFIDAHRAADLPILNTSPYHEASEAIQLMTAYKAKGLEFEAVFVIAAQDNVWGRASRTQSSTLSLPSNLEYIRYAGATDDERLRLLYVAMTRAKSQLYLTSYTQTLTGKLSPRLKYLQEQTDEDGVLRSGILGEAAVTQEGDTRTELPAPSVIEHYWQQRHHPPFQAELKAFLKPRLDKYQLSPTHLNQFTDLLYGGPEDFFINTILRFPRGPTADGQYGNAVHETLQFINQHQNGSGSVPDLEKVLEYFEQRLREKRLSKQQTDQLLERGRKNLPVFYEQFADEFLSGDIFEVSFSGEGVFVGPAHLGGRIDKLRVDREQKTVFVTDFKTGKSYSKWIASDPKLHKYRQQLLSYKLLVEGSHTFRGYTVTHADLVFVEPDDEGLIHRIQFEFDDDQLSRHKKLLVAVWEHVLALDFPNTDAFAPTMKGIHEFEESLLKKS